MFLTQLIILASIGGKVFGIVIPALIFLISFVVTWLLYKHFSTR